VVKNRAGSKKYGYKFIHIGANDGLWIKIDESMVEYVALPAMYVIENRAGLYG
jgi:hypothetical protein